MLNSNNSTGNYGRRWARIRFRGDLYTHESTFPLVCDAPSVSQYRGRSINLTLLQLQLPVASCPSAKSWRVHRAWGGGYLSNRVARFPTTKYGIFCPSVRLSHVPTNASIWFHTYWQPATTYIQAAHTVKISIKLKLKSESHRPLTQTQPQSSLRPCMRGRTHAQTDGQPENVMPTVPCIDAMMTTVH